MKSCSAVFTCILSKYTVYKDFPSPAMSDFSQSSPPTSVPYARTRTHTHTHWQQIQVRMRSGHAMYVTCLKHRLCQTKNIFARCGQRSISCSSWSTCATACKETCMENSRKMMEKYHFQILSVAFDHGKSMNMDEYGTFAESFAAIWSSSSNSTTRDEAADSSSNCLNSNSSKLASLSTDPTVTSTISKRICSQIILPVIFLTFIGHWTIIMSSAICWLPCQEAGSQMLGFSLLSRHPAAPGTVITIKYLLQTLIPLNGESNI